jgi:predicted methyltransferase
MTLQSIRSRASILWLLLLVLVAAAAFGCSAPKDLESRLSHSDRPAEDKARDAGRKPAAVLEFMGVEEGMTVMDLLAAGGYYTEVLSIAVGPEGHVYAQNTDFLLKMRDGAADKAMTARLAGNRLPNVERLDREITNLGLAPNSLDFVMTALNFHDIYNGRGPEAAQAVLAAIMDVLKPGGVLGIVDHAGNPGADNEKLHRIEESKVIDAAREAGFIVEDTSDVLRNPSDDRTRFVFAEGLRGSTDRFVLRLRKPG